MVVCIAGSTGLTGSFLLEKLLHDSDVSKVYALVRKPSSRRADKLIEITFNGDFSKVELPEKADAFFCCLGTTIKKAGSQDAFRLVDVQLPTQLIAMAEKMDARSFVLQSSVSAQADSSNFYLKCKGEVENKLKLSSIPIKCTVRPSILAGPRKEFRLGEKIGLVLMQLLRPLFIGKLKRYRAVHVDRVAESMLKAAKSQEPGWLIIESEAL